MKKFIIEPSFFEIFPDAHIGIIVCNGIDCAVRDENRYVPYLAECQKAAQAHIAAPEFIQNPVIKTWREAFYKFKTKKGARCSIEALLKRVSKGEVLRPIIPLVDIYNGISLKYGVPVGGENIDAIEGNLRLTVACGGEPFITYGSDKSEPPYEGEVVYKDDAGAVCRCFNWRESVRTMLTEETTNAFMCLESVDASGEQNLTAAVTELKALIEAEFGGTCRMAILSRECPETVIEE